MKGRDRKEDTEGESNRHREIKPYNHDLCRDALSNE